MRYICEVMGNEQITENNNENDEEIKNILTDTMIGALKNDYDDKIMNSERIEEHENTNTY